MAKNIRGITFSRCAVSTFQAHICLYIYLYLYIEIIKCLQRTIVTNTILYFSQRFTIISIHSLYRTIVQLHSLGTALNMYKRSQPHCCIQKYILFRKQVKQANLDIPIESQIQTRLITSMRNLPIKKKKRDVSSLM